MQRTQSNAPLLKIGYRYVTQASLEVSNQLEIQTACLNKSNVMLWQTKMWDNSHQFFSIYRQHCYPHWHRNKMLVPVAGICTWQFRLHRGFHMHQQFFPRNNLWQSWMTVVPGCSRLFPREYMQGHVSCNYLLKYAHTYCKCGQPSCPNWKIFVVHHL